MTDDKFPGLPAEYTILLGLDDEWQGAVNKLTRAKPVPTLPTDEGRLEIEPRTGAADQWMEDFETIAFVSEVTDLPPQAVRKLSATREPSRLAKRLTISEREQQLNQRLTNLIYGAVRRELVPIVAERTMAQREQELFKRAPVRRRKFVQMLRPLRALFGDIEPHEDRFSKLIDEMEKFTVATIIANA
jgi:hypothetical protein